MQTSDRPAFLEVMSKLCAVYDKRADKELIESYWGALNKMSLKDFRRIADHCTTNDERMPRPARIWAVYRDDQRAERQSVLDKPQTPERAFDPILAFGNRCLLRYLLDHGAASDDSLPVLVSEKNRLVNEFKLIATEDHITAEEVREMMFAAFRKVHEPV